HREHDPAGEADAGSDLRACTRAAPAVDSGGGAVFHLKREERSNAECGVRNAEFQGEVARNVTLTLTFRIPHSALRTGGRGGCSASIRKANERWWRGWPTMGGTASPSPRRWPRRVRRCARAPGLRP